METYIEDIFKSRALSKCFLILDSDIQDLEYEIERLNKENRKMHEQICESLDRQTKEGMSMMTNTLKAILDVPETESLGTVGVSILVKLREMKTVEAIHEHIDKIFKQTKKNYKTNKL